MCIDLDGAGVLVKRIFAFVAIDQKRDLDADPGRAPALWPLRRAGVGVFDSGRFGLLQCFEDLAQCFARSSKSGSSPRIRRNGA